MDRYSRWVIIILSLQLTISGMVISHLCYKLGYEQGRASLINDRAGEGDVGTCYQTGGCGELPDNSKHVKHGHHVLGVGK